MEIHTCNVWCTRPECIADRTGVLPSPAEITPGMEFVFKWLYRRGVEDGLKAAEAAIRSMQENNHDPR
jgi:hypothetical protein